MQSALTPQYSRTLVVDASTAQGGRRTDQLKNAGSSAEFSVSWRAARAALRTHRYNSCIVVTDIGKAEDLKQLAELRRAGKRVWMIALCDRQHENALLIARRQGVDALMCAPVSCSI